jgi:phage terminase large subunit-like protein
MILIASQHFNVEIGQRLRNNGWAGGRYWQVAQYSEPLTLDDLIRLCDVIVAGVDGGGLDDLLGVAFAGRHAVTKEWLFVFRAWAQPSVLEQRKDIVANLRDFEKEGTLVICGEDDPTQDVREVADMMEKVWKAKLFPKKAAIGLDPVGVAAITDEIAGRGIGGDEPHFMAAVPQGYKLSGNIKGFERKLMDGTAWHDGSELMTWCTGNARVELRGNATLITKQVSGSAKIDPLMAGFNAFALLALNPDGIGSGIDDYFKSLAASA